CMFRLGPLIAEVSYRLSGPETFSGSSSIPKRALPPGSGSSAISWITGADMLKTRIIPTMLWKDVGLVKGIGFDSWRRTGTLMPAIKVYNARQVDELILVDIMATGESRVPDFDMISEIS